MPKRSLDRAKLDPTMPLSKARRNVGRSHEENQERAYIAASRRADRSIKARVQSARMANEIHKKRTGKCFHITEEIVMKEEMYEEEEDGFRRSYRLLGPHMPIAFPEMNFRLEACLSNIVAMSALLARTNDWRENKLKTLASQTSPNVREQAQHLQHLSNPEYRSQTNYKWGIPQSPVSPTFHAFNYQQAASPHNQYHRSLSCVAPSELIRQDKPVSPPALTPSSASAETPRACSTPNIGHIMPTYRHNDFAFTTELPDKAKMLIGGVDINNTFTHGLYRRDLMNQTQYHDPSELTRLMESGESEAEFYLQLLENSMASPLKWDARA